MNERRAGILTALLVISVGCTREASATQAPDESPRTGIIEAGPGKPAQSPRGAYALSLRVMGRRFGYDPATGLQRDTTLYLVTLGDPEREDERALNRAQAGFGAFAMNAAQYFPNEDGTWRVFNFRLPRDNDEADKQAFLDFLASREARDVLQDAYERKDFGKPSGFVYRRMRLEAAELPYPFNRSSREALAPFIGIFIYNADSTGKLLIRQPNDEDGKAQEVFAGLKCGTP